MSRKFNPPPGWPSPPPGWRPGPGWQPDPSWPAPPEGWPFWIDEPPAAGHDQSAREIHAKFHERHYGAATRPAQRVRTGRSYRIPILHALSREGEWSRSDSLTAIGLLIAIAAIVTPITVNSASSGVPYPNLHVEEVEIARASNIDATVQNPVGHASSVKSVGSAVDITLRNRGTAPALIVGAAFSFTRSTELDNCIGAGPGVVTAQYDIKVPSGKDATAKGPLILHRDMRFIVNANSIDRFTMSVGPRSYGLSSWPWIYKFDLSLIEDNGRRLDLGPMSMLGLPGASWDKFRGLTPGEVAAAQQLPCVARDASELSQAMNGPGLHSPELKTMYKEAEALTAGLPSCHSQSAAPDGSGCDAAKGRFFSDPRGVTTCGGTIEVVQSYNCNVAEDIAKAFEKARVQGRVSMTFTSGLLTLPMRCVRVHRAEVCRSIDNQDLVVGFIP